MRVDHTQNSQRYRSETLAMCGKLCGIYTGHFHRIFEYILNELYVKQTVAKLIMCLVASELSLQWLFVPFNWKNK